MVSCIHSIYLCTIGAQDPPAPELFTAEFVTDISDTPIVIEVPLIFSYRQSLHGPIPNTQVTRSLAPLGADRFYALVQDGFYDQSALFRWCMW